VEHDDDDRVPNDEQKGDQPGVDQILRLVDPKRARVLLKRVRRETLLVEMVPVSASC
jgi:hypothetical protein